MSSPPQNPTVLEGAVLIVGMRWADRLIGVMSTLILARLLAPEDFGIIAMASLFVQLLDMLMDLGVNVALIQNSNATEEHYDSAWTLRLMQTSIGAIATVAAAPLAAAYFNDSRIEAVLPCMAIGFLLSGLENIWVIDFQKRMQFRRDVLFTLSRRLAGFLATAFLAWILQSYWALVLGALFGRATGVALSYLMHSGRPSLCLRQWRSIFSVSQWMIVNNIGRYLDGSLPSLLVGRRNDAAIMGGFSLAREVSGMPTTEILIPLNRVLFPFFVKAARDHDELKRVYLLAQAVQCMIGIPAGVGLAIIAPEAVTILLGERWAFVAPFVKILALSSVIVAVTTSGNYVMITLGAIRNAALISWIRVSAFVLLAVVLIPSADALKIAQLRLVTAAVGFGIAMWMILYTLPNLTILDIGKSVFRPLIAAAAMAFIVLLLQESIDGPMSVLLAVKIASGASSYFLILFVLWLLSGRPDGAESYILSIITRQFERMRA